MYCLPQGYTYKSFIATSDGGFLAYSHENVLIKFNAQKTIDWTYSFPSNNINYLMKETSDGNFLISGMFELLLADNQTNSYAAKINPQGNLIWEINYGNEQNEFPFSIGEYSDGNFFLVAHIVTGKNNFMFTTITYNQRYKAIIQRMLPLLLASLAANIIWAQDAAEADAPAAPKEVFYDSTVAYVLLTVIGLLALVIYMLGNVFVLAIKTKWSRKNNPVQEKQLHLLS